MASVTVPKKSEKSCPNNQTGVEASTPPPNTTTRTHTVLDASDIEDDTSNENHILEQVEGGNSCQLMQVNFETVRYYLLKATTCVITMGCVFIIALMCHYKLQLICIRHM
jgi:hypothetical protein